MFVFPTLFLFYQFSVYGFHPSHYFSSLSSITFVFITVFLSIHIKSELDLCRQVYWTMLTMCPCSVGPSTRRMLKPITTKAAAWNQTLFPTASEQRTTWLLLKLKKKSTYPHNALTTCCIYLAFSYNFIVIHLNLLNVSRFPLFGKKYQLKFANDVSAETHCLVHFPSFIRFPTT